MRILNRTFSALLAAIMLVSVAACASLPGGQTLGLSSDPDQTTKQALVASGFVVDAVGVYGALPSCVTTKGLCRDDRAYANAKLVATSGVTGIAQLAGQKSPSGILMTAGLLYMQWQISKNLAHDVGPTDPSSPPAPASVAYLQALGLADVLVQTADSRIQAASGPNVTVAELVSDLENKVATLP